MANCNHPHHHETMVLMPLDMMTRLVAAGRTVMDKTNPDDPNLTPAQREELKALHQAVRTAERSLNQLAPILAARQARLN